MLGIIRHDVSYFYEFDTDNTGYISLENLRDAIASSGGMGSGSSDGAGGGGLPRMDAAEIGKMFEGINLDASTPITYNDFLAATLHDSVAGHDPKLLRAVASRSAPLVMY